MNINNFENLNNKENFLLKVIGRIHTDFSTKFGIPRQSGLVNELEARIIFLPQYRNIAAFKGIEDFSHLWLLWLFSETIREQWSPTVRPPRLGGNTKKGVFATRSPFRPNPIGLSCVMFDRLTVDSKYGPVLYVKGADLMDGTPILDIKPYLPFTESHPDALGGFADSHKNDGLEVSFESRWLNMVPRDKQAALIKVLANDPRPSYQHDPKRVYGFTFAGLDIRFKVSGQSLTVCEVVKV